MPLSIRCGANAYKPELAGRVSEIHFGVGLVGSGAFGVDRGTEIDIIAELFGVDFPQRLWLSSVLYTRAAVARPMYHLNFTCTLDKPIDEATLNLNVMLGPQ